MCVCGGFFALLFSLEFFFLCRLFIAYESLQCREETRNSAWRKEGWDVNVYYTGKKEMLDPDALKTQWFCQGFIPRWLFLPAIIFSKVETRRSQNSFNHKDASQQFSAEMFNVVCVLDLKSVFLWSRAKINLQFFSLNVCHKIRKLYNAASPPSLLLVMELTGLQ